MQLSKKGMTDLYQILKVTEEKVCKSVWHKARIVMKNLNFEKKQEKV